MCFEPREFEPRYWHSLIFPERLWLKRIILFLGQLKNFSLSWNPFLHPFFKSKNFLTPELSWHQKYCFWGPIFFIQQSVCIHLQSCHLKNKKTQTWRSLLLRTLRKSQNLFNKYSTLIGYTHRCDPQKQQILFVSSAQKSI